MTNDEFVFAVDTMKPLDGRCIQVFGERKQGGQQHNKQTISLVCREETLLLMLKDAVRRLEAGDFR